MSEFRRTLITLQYPVTFSTSGVMRPEQDNEVRVISVSQAGTMGNNEAVNGAHLAVDGDLATQAYTSKGSYSNAWFIASLGTGYCIDKVMNWWAPDPSHVDTHTCSRSSCTCAGSQCARWVVSVYYGDNRSPNYSGHPASGCKLGDLVKIETLNYSDNLDIDDLAIIEKGEFSYKEFDNRPICSSKLGWYNRLLNSNLTIPTDSYDQVVGNWLDK